MKIIVKRNEQNPEITIDLKDVHYAYAIRNALMLALEIDGFAQETINDVFNLGEDVKCQAEE